MDAYVAKPVRSDELFAAIDAIITPSSEPNAPPPTSAARAGGTIDLSALLENFGGRGDLVRDVVDVFLVDAPIMLTRLDNAVSSGNASDIAAAAHAIKGSAGLFSQGEAYTNARTLETRARAGDVGDGAHTAGEIAAAVSRLMDELRDLRTKL
jgi:two-component system, sensor histidine kinase and response regulator